MKIVIIGAGALGRLFGAYLSQGGKEVLFIEPDQEVVAAINDKGIGVASRESQDAQLLQYYPAHAVADGREISQGDLLFLTVKSYHTHDAIQHISHLIGPDCPLVTLQNGLGHLDIIEKICDPNDIISGFTAMAGTALGPGEVMNDGIGTTYLGQTHQNSTEPIEKTCTMLNESGIPAKHVTDIISRKWNRVLVHAAINPVSALLRCRNSQLLENMHSLSLMKRLLDEGRDIAEAKGIDLGDVDHYEILFTACRDKAEHLSPMLQDIINGRKTEVDALNGILVHYARQTGVAAESHITIYELLKSLESKENIPTIQDERF